ncbi:hypothetical protein D3C80_1935080 [compost metagenome]
MHLRIAVLARQVERAHQRPPPFPVQARVNVSQQGPALAEQLAKCLEHELVLAVEVRIEASHGKPCSTHDLADAWLGGAVLDQRASRSLKDPLAGLGLLVAHGRLTIRI